MTLAEEYAEGYALGCKWADEDRASSIPSASEVTLIREESQADNPRSRAFYLGALRGYRSVARTKLGGRWGL